MSEIGWGLLGVLRGQLSGGWQGCYEIRRTKCQVGGRCWSLLWRDSNNILPLDPPFSMIVPPSGIECSPSESGDCSAQEE